MSSDSITLKLEKREVVGKQVRALRRSGQTPAVIYNHGKESILVEAPFAELTKVYQQAGRHAPVELTVGSDKYLGIIKEVDLDPRKNTLRHVVFSALRQNEKTKAEIPVHLEGEEIPAEKAGYMVIKNLEHVEVEALPKNLPDAITVNAEVLTNIGDKITVGDVVVPEGVTIITELEHPIATVEETKAQMSEEAEEASETEDEVSEGSEESAQETKPKSED